MGSIHAAEGFGCSFPRGEPLLSMTSHDLWPVVGVAGLPPPWSRSQPSAWAWRETQVGGQASFSLSPGRAQGAQSVRGLLFSLSA